MKKILFVALWFTALCVNAQQKQVKNMPNYDKHPLHFGFSVGFNSMDFGLVHSADFLASNGDEGYKINEIYGIENYSHTGLNLGPISSFRLGNFFDFRFLINLSFGQRDLYYKVAQDTTNGQPQFYTHIMKMESTYIEFPLLIKYKARRLNNYRPYVIAGFNPKLDLAAKKKVKEIEMPKIRVKNFDVFYEIGSGVDFYLPYFKFSVELKYGQGLLNLLRPDGTQYTKALDKIYSKMWIVSFHFEGHH